MDMAKQQTRESLMLRLVWMLFFFIAWQVGEVLFTGDVAGVRINGQVPVAPCPPPGELTRPTRVA